MKLMIQLVMCVIASACFAQSPQMVTLVTGIITDSVTKSPIRDAKVACDCGQQPVDTLTDSAGSYHLTGRGTAISFTVSHNNYEPARIQLNMVNTVNIQDVELQPLSIVTGDVTEGDSGKKVASIVEAFRKESIAGLLLYSRSGTVVAGAARGTFEIDSLSPGTYVFEAFAAPSPGGTSYRNLGMESREYPYQVMPPDATISAVIGVGEHRVLNFRVPSQSSHQLSGLIEAPIDTPDQELKVAIGLVNEAFYFSRKYALKMTNGRAPFHLNGLAPGNYRVTAEGAGVGADRLFGELWVNVKDNDIEDFKLSLTPGARILGYVKTSDRDKPVPDGLTVNLTRVWTAPNLGAVPALDDGPPIPVTNAMFRGGPVAPGDYWPTLAGLPPGYAVSSIEFNASETVDGVAPFAGTVSLTFVVTSRLGSASGFVVDENDQPASDALVVLLPSAARSVYPPNVIRTAPTQKGSFVFPNVAPGRYRVLALDAQSARYVGNPIALAHYSEKGSVIEIKPEEICAVGRLSTESK